MKLKINKIIKNNPRPFFFLKEFFYFENLQRDGKRNTIMTVQKALILLRNAYYLQIIDLGSTNLIIVNRNVGDVGNFGPNFAILFTALFSKQRTPIDVELSERGRQPLSCYSL